MNNEHHTNHALFTDYTLQKGENFFIKISEVINEEHLSESELKEILTERENYWINQIPPEKCYNSSDFKFKDQMNKISFSVFHKGDQLDQLEVLIKILKNKNQPISNIDFQEFGLEFEELMRYLNLSRNNPK